jgi:tRNA(Ile)-lysidine synthase
MQNESMARMVNRFKSFITENQLCRPGDKILVAVSGGMDSMAMLSLFLKTGYRVGIAHCNFGLRGMESDGDEEFVKGAAEKFKVPVYFKRYGNADFTHKNGLSVQMAAREMRYAWFEETRISKGYDWIAVAHHLDDQAETFFINLARGTGISGLHGILPQQGKVIRPLLFASREEIESFVRENKLGYRDDSPNTTVKYLRNKIRHELMPVLKEINPGMTASLAATISRLRDFEMIGQPVIAEARDKIVTTKGEQTEISISGLKALQPLAIFAWEILSPFGFNQSQVSDIILSLDSESGRRFYSSTHRLIRDREALIITQVQDDRWKMEEDQKSYLIEEGTTSVDFPVTLKLRVIECNQGIEIPMGREFASLDLAKLEFPLTLRRWQKGDSFYPFGMTRKQKLSDYFINAKISLSEKEETWVVCSGTRIAWIVGLRADNRFRITGKTAKILQVKLMP